MPDLVHDPVSRVRMSFEPDGENLLVDCWMEPGGGLPAHLHPLQIERWSVVEGRVRFRLGDEWREIGPQDGELVVDPGTVHGLRSITEEDVHLRCRVEPALRLQAFLEESSAAAHDGLFTSRGLPRGLRGARWAARFLKTYGDETVMISPPRPVQKLFIALFARGD
jgi:quercetin dioxygenase-like cupin family protein